MESSDYFLEEIKFNKENARNNPFLKISTQINYFYVEFFMFLICLIINFYMLTVLSIPDILNGTTIKYAPKDHETPIADVALADIQNHEYIIRILSGIQVGLNAFFLFIWMFSKFILYIKIDKKKYCAKNDINEKDLKWYHNYIYIGIYYSIYIRNEVMMLIWNIAFGTFGLCFYSDFIYSVQLLNILNLSQILKNIIVAIKMRWKQLFATGILTLIIIYTYTIFGYSYVNEIFVKVKLGSVK